MKSHDCAPATLCGSLSLVPPAVQFSGRLTLLPTRFQCVVCVITFVIRYWPDSCSSRLSKLPFATRRGKGNIVFGLDDDTSVIRRRATHGQRCSESYEPHLDKVAVEPLRAERGLDVESTRI